MRIAAAAFVTTASVIGLMWWAIQELRQTINAAIERNDNLAAAFDQFVTRTLQGADTVTELVKSGAEL